MTTVNEIIINYSTTNYWSSGQSYWNLQSIKNQVKVETVRKIVYSYK